MVGCWAVLFLLSLGTYAGHKRGLWQKFKSMHEEPGGKIWLKIMRT